MIDFFVLGGFQSGNGKVVKGDGFWMDRCMLGAYFVMSLGFSVA